MSRAESQDTKEGCNTLPELKIGSLAHDGTERCSLYMFFSLTVFILLMPYLAQVRQSCRIKVVHLITWVFTYAKTMIQS